MNSLLVLCTVLAAGALVASGCGSARNRSTTAAAVTGHDEDGDIDSLSQGGLDRDNDATLGWAPPADAATRRAVVALVRRYYTVAAAGDGARACSMLDPLLIESLEEDQGARRGRTLPAGSRCSRALSALFAQRHRELVEDLAAFRITVVQRRGNQAVALADFAPTRILEVFVRRLHGVWRMNTPLFTGAE